MDDWPECAERRNTRRSGGRCTRRVPLQTGGLRLGSRAAPVWHEGCDERPVLGRLLTGLVSLVAILMARSESLPTREIPFVFTNGLIWLQVSVPQAERPLHFLFDSGAAVSVINLDSARRLRLKLGSPVGVSGVGSTSRGYWPQRLEARAGEVRLPKQYLAVDLAQLSDACNCCVDGLLGADFLRGQAVQIDFTQHKLRLMPSKSPPEDGVLLNLKTSRGALLAPVRVNGSEAQWVRLDTGCASALQWVTDAAPDRRWNAGVSIGLAEVSIPVAPANVRLGSKEFSAVPTGWHGKPIFAGEGGLLGNGLLSRFERVTIDAKAGTLLLSGETRTP